MISPWATSNGELIEQIARYAQQCGRRIATPQVAREILQLRP
jgi:uncharacterized protein (DUF849 family)